MTDSDTGADSQPGPQMPEPDRFVEVVRDVAREAGVDEASLPGEEIAEAGDLDEAWEGLRTLHDRVDVWLEEGRISVEQARELRSRLLDLSRTLADRAMQDEAERYRQLLRDVSHDIRSPLHSIIFLAEAMHSGRNASLNESDRRQLGTIYAASTSLLNLVNDLLDYARLGEEGVGEVAETSFTVDGVMSDVRHLLAPLVEHYETDYSVRAPGNARFIGDPQLLCRMLTNLVSNAIEASGRGGNVGVVVAHEDGGLAVEVVDDGEGADAARMECLLSRPEGESLADCAGEKRRGRTHGLGLLISGRLLEAAGGRAEVEPVDRESGNPDDETSGGTRVRVWLPFRRASNDA